jgi:VCBS repeat-containing protein
VTVALASQPAHGTVTLNSDGSFRYTPNTGGSGSDSFTYTVSDGHGGWNVATVSLTVKARGTWE